MDVRAGEVGPLLAAAGTYFLLIAGHTLLETARDALFLSRLPPRLLGPVYATLALASLPVTILGDRFARRFGRKSALVVLLLGAAYGTFILSQRAMSPTLVFVVYLWSGLLGTVLAAQFWLLTDQIFTVAQGSRLFGPIAAGGLLGAAAGAGGAVLLLGRMSVAGLLPVAAFCFLATAAAVTYVPAEGHDAGAGAASLRRPPVGAASPKPFHQYPYLYRVTALAVVATAAGLVADYLLKMVAVRAAPGAALGPFFARYYAALNVTAFVVQVVLAGRAVRRLGVVAALGVLPALLLAGSAWGLLTGSWRAALANRGADGVLRHSLQRVATELLWMPLPGPVRDAAKSLVDTFVVRAVQALTAGALFAAAAYGLGSQRHLTAALGALAAAWLAAAMSLHRPYLNMFRRALEGGKGALTTGPAELDQSSAEVLVEALASDEPARVLAAMDVLEERGRERLVPALVLYHDDDAVLRRALEMFGRSGRRDWQPLARRLLARGGEPARIAAAHALFAAGDAESLRPALADASAAVRAHATLLLTSRGGDEAGPPEGLAGVVELLALGGAPGRQARLALLDAIALSGDARWGVVLSALLRDDDGSVVAQAARAMARVGDPRFVAELLPRLAVRDGRDAVRDALAQLGEPALAALERAVHDPATPPRVRLHIPRTIARFGTQRAADFLAGLLPLEGLSPFHYKTVLGLERLARHRDVRVSAAAVATELSRVLVEHLRALGLIATLERGQRAEPRRARAGGRLLVGLLEDHAEHARNLALHLLHVAHPGEDMNRLGRALSSPDRRVRANAREFLSLLTLGGRGPLATRNRDLLLLVVEDLPRDERAARAAPLLPEPVPADYGAALGLLARDRHEDVASLAAYHLAELGPKPAGAAPAASAARPPPPLTPAALRTLAARWQPSPEPPSASPASSSGARCSWRACPATPPTPG
jgi:ATP:ADP antiporter, AAA family